MKTTAASSHSCTLALLSALLAFGCTAQTLKIGVANPSSVRRANEPVEVAWSRVGSLLKVTSADRLALSDEQGRPMAFQADDIDGDGVPDEIAFLAELGPKQDRSFTLSVRSSGSLQMPKDSLRVDASNWKRVKEQYQPLDDDEGPGLLRNQSSYKFDGIGWESELIGYRLYLDERNAVDIQGKHKKGLYWDYIGRSGVDYQQDLGWGMDVLHIGSALGVGGFAIWDGDSVSKPYKLDRRRCRILARGPVRTTIRVAYTGWQIADKKFDIEALYTMYNGDRVTEERISLRTDKTRLILATGIVKHPPAAAVWDERGGLLYTLGAQSRANDSLLMSVRVPRAEVLKKTEDAVNQLLLLPLESGKPQRLLIGAVWQGELWEGWKQGRATDMLMPIESAGLRMTAPLEISIAQ